MIFEPQKGQKENKRKSEQSPKAGGNAIPIQAILLFSLLTFVVRKKRKIWLHHDPNSLIGPVLQQKLTNHKRDKGTQKKVKQGH